VTGAVTATQVGSSPRCRSCQAPIWFGLTEKGRRMPLDPAPVEDGNVVIVTLEGRMETEVANLGRARAQRANAGDAELPRVRTLRNGEHVPADLPTYVSHFATCPEAQSHRRTKSRASATPAERGASSAAAPRPAGIGGAR
jgi:hypothetical protein